KPARCHRTSVSGRMVVIAFTIDGNHRYNWRKNRRIAVRELDPTAHLALKHDQLTSERGILSLKSADRPERRNQQSQKEAEQRDHRGRRYVIPLPDQTDEVFGTHTQGRDQADRHPQRASRALAGIDARVVGRRSVPRRGLLWRLPVKESGPERSTG